MTSRVAIKPRSRGNITLSPDSDRRSRQRTHTNVGPTVEEPGDRRRRTTDVRSFEWTSCLVDAISQRQITEKSDFGHSKSDTRADPPCILRRSIVLVLQILGITL